MIKKLLTILLVIFLNPTSLLAKKEIIGYIQFLKGNVHVISLNTKKQKKLKVKDPFYFNTIIKTGKKSSVLIKFANGIKKYLSENSKIIIFKSTLKRYKETDKMEQLIISGGEKAFEIIVKTGFIDDQKVMSIREKISQTSIP